MKPRIETVEIYDLELPVIHVTAANLDHWHYLLEPSGDAIRGVPYTVSHDDFRVVLFLPRCEDPGEISIPRILTISRMG